MNIALYKGKSFISKLIKWQTRGKYSHAAIIFKDGKVIEAWQAGDSLVRFMPSVNEGHTLGTEVDIFKVKTTSKQDKVIYDFMRGQVGKKYDWGLILGFLTRGDTDNRDKWICSELVFAAFKVAGIDLLAATNAYEVSPSLIRRSTLLEYVETVRTVKVKPKTVRVRKDPK